MTAAFDATRGTDQRFTDALSGSDGTADPSILMPVLDMYPDALAAPMPIDLVPVIVPPTPLPPDAAVDPIFRTPAPPARPRSAAAQPGRPRPAQRGTQSTGKAQAYVPPNQRLMVPRTPPAPNRPAPIRPAPAPPAGPTFSWQGRQLSAGDVAAALRSGFGQQGQVDRTSFQATHPQSQGSAAPAAFAPAAPMASQYTQRGQVRNTARNQAQERRSASSGMKKRASSTWAVIVFLIVIGFSTGLLQKIIEFVTEAINK